LKGAFPTLSPGGWFNNHNSFIRVIHRFPLPELMRLVLSSRLQTSDLKPSGLMLSLSCDAHSFNDSSYFETSPLAETSKDVTDSASDRNACCASSKWLMSVGSFGVSSLSR